MTYHKHRNFYGFIIAAVAIIRALSRFITAVTERGRLIELFISTPILILAYYYVYQINPPFPIYFIPITAYVVYWGILFGTPKVVHSSTEIHWQDEDWWWSLSGFEFEEEVAKVFRKNKYIANVTRRTRDNGVDIIMYKDKKKIVVQCKHYKEEVGPEAVRALWGVKDEFKADIVILVASSGVTKTSMKFINNKKPYYKMYTLSDIMRMA